MDSSGNLPCYWRDPGKAAHVDLWGGEVWIYQLSSFDEKQSEAAITCLENRDCPAGERIEIITLEAKSRSCLGVLLNVLRSRRLTSDSSKLIEEAGLEWKLHFLACRSDAGAVAEIGKRYEADSMKTGAQTIGQTNAPRPLGYFDSANVIAAAAQLRAQVPALMHVHLNEEVRKHEAVMQRYPVRHPDHAVFLREKIQVYESVRNLNLAAQADLAKEYCEKMNQYVIARDFLEVEKPDIAWRTMGHAG
ncbi:hypothetical protein F2P44_24130 [Massilia sp. CCM 8695]|uniref:Uncharacterized protein n=1 Tax=Massilia frigida TaxID=2609281 RepID=A0ABX0NJU9_9BURK|nr:hypothetical protein [Massilia frigida]NHZ82345.1 hypothetical protein [Massilia frigida]